MANEGQQYLCIQCGKNFDSEVKYEIHFKAYHRLREFKERHQYGVAMRNIGSPAHQKRQHSLVSHWNSLNINS